MNIDDSLLTKLEKLSSLKIGDDKREEIKNQLSEILNFVDILNELDLDDLKAVVSSIEGGTPFRDDIDIKSEVVDVILKNAPARNDHFFVVPKIIE
ncbi:Asp-tRNA(Asn)/Glu-tRNA(Gln) amidotransferase subunit GatC [Campylobacter sp. RM16187]|uniref:Asp-tRNA(Asn)/Glu-tRNA(Gln) amidotransferase subunit GatC n=1 Tax=Campylobacter sp. RM16187 TaxID=1660063 RepID=UPI0021B5660E|nr:Asp-tRNA(Asn)/Glu-tRNA(Gln) amidotransferase subunit GatC [Campylobacter sp. RM16187]QKG28852.1 Glu-tRNA(Gln) amidotransferase, subunit C [Campylobacter sp. RM16187]